LDKLLLYIFRKRGEEGKRGEKGKGERREGW